jgi:hypothetical protein
MPPHKSVKLPSIEELVVNKNFLPSVDDFLNKNLEQPSVTSFIVEERNTIIDDLDESFHEKNEEEEEVDDKENLTEIIRLINDVRESIPEIPEIKYYDNELSILSEKIEIIRNYISNFPEIKYYDSDIDFLKEEIDEVKTSIPKFPQWINEVNEVPDFSWIGKTFSVIDDDFIKVNDQISLLKDNIDSNVDKLLESISKKEFDIKVDINHLNEKVYSIKDKIYEELRESALKIWKIERQYKSDSKQLKEEIRKEYSTLEKNIKKNIETVNEDLSSGISEIEKYFLHLQEEVKNLPKVKYYDEDIKHLNNKISFNSKDITELKQVVDLIKKQQNDIRDELREELNEGLLNIPPEVKNSDPLTPLDQNFATLEDLSNHYKIFINRIQTQLSAMGGGGAGYVKDLSDVDITGITTDSVLSYDYSNSKWIASKTLSGIGKTTLLTLNDVNPDDLGDGKFLRYDASSNKFTFSPVSATNLELVAGDIQSGVLTTTSTNESIIISINSNVYRSVNYQIQVSEGSNFNMTTINVIHDGSNTYMTEYGTINQPVGIATFSTDLSGTALRLLAYPASSNATTFKVIFTAIES